MRNHTEILPDIQIEEAWGNASFGGTQKRDVVNNSLLKYACGYSTGHTAMCILQELNLISKKEVMTTLGKEYLFAAFSGGNSF